ncbi:MAG TPA: DUF3467 domain-containing protein [Tepidisphaeraceae bacterium]|nr:DUF3467 domain-containing protein [Tepidisphaeraceae bacterium]
MSEFNASDESGPRDPGQPGDPGQPPPGEPPVIGNLGTHSQQFSHNPVSARVPEKVARGAHATGVVVLDSPTEFVIDFLQGVTRPHQVAARVIMHPVVMSQLAAALQDNVNKYNASFGPIQNIATPPQRRPTIQEIYENFKLNDEMLSGVYANSVMIGHSRAEFFLDFITGFFPTAAVSSRVFVSAFQAPRILETLSIAIQQYQKRHGAGPQLPPPQTPGN